MIVWIDKVLFMNDDLVILYAPSKLIETMGLALIYNPVWLTGLQVPAN